VVKKKFDQLPEVSEQLDPAYFDDILELDEVCVMSKSVVTKSGHGQHSVVELGRLLLLLMATVVRKRVENSGKKFMKPIVLA
jgi:hypothetical protein